jgi:hypothetical protein
MFVCAGCRPEPLGYALFEVGDSIDAMQVCPMRDVCTWYAAHDLGGEFEYADQPEGAILPALFRSEPYFACRNFYDYEKFIAGEPAATIVTPPVPHAEPAAQIAASGEHATSLT